MEEYIEKLISQIRCKKARPYIAEEIRDHIEEQMAEYKENGMSDEEAEKNAVLDMGDPVEVGISLDRIHKPKMGWNVIVIVGIISLLAILVQWAFASAINNYGLEQLKHMSYNDSMRKFLKSIFAGMLFMMVIYFVDYTVIAKYSKIIGLFIIGAGLYTVLFGTSFHGARYYIFNLTGISATSFMMLYVPVYGAILYKYRGGGFGALLKCIAWLLIPTFITVKIPSLGVAGILLICMLVQLTIAVCKGWFKVNKRAALIGLWTAFLLLPFVSLFGLYSLHLLADYQEARIRSWLLPNQEEGYVLSVIREYTQNVPMFGKSQKDILGYLPDLNRDYIFTYIINSYGSLAGIIILSVLAVLLVFLFGAVMRQKNELGFTMGVGCGMILLMNAVINICCSIGVLPPSASFLPFFSAGGSNMILCYALIGIVLSIYRYKDVYPGNISDRVVIKKKLDINL